MDTLHSIWNKMPAVRLLLPYMAGIGICIGMGYVRYALPAAFVLMAAGMAGLICINLGASVPGVYKWRFLSGIAVSVTMLASGYVVTFFNSDDLNPHHLSHMDPTFTDREASYIGVISDPVMIRDRTVSALISVQRAGAGDSSIAIEGNIVASMVKDSRSQALQYGDRVAFKGRVQPYEGPKNPGQFDYRQYQALHHIFQRVYLTPKDWKVTDRGQGNHLLAWIYSIRSYFLSLIKSEVPGANELAVATAIMLGYRDYITDEVIQAYVGSGVLHVLSVSGLHVAVLYFVLSTLLGWMDRSRRLEIAKGVLVIMIMLFYACLTGLSPPVLRSVWMFTLMTIARLLDRDISMFNVLGASCLLLLIWDPYYIADVGFQLSYIAVAGIVYLYPLFFEWLDVPLFIFPKPFVFFGAALTWSLRWTWGLICVSLAAQLATFPVSVYYFHRFPNFFLLSNLLVIPLSNFVLISGMVMFAAGWCRPLLVCAGWVFNHLLIILNHVVFWVDGLPGALSAGMVVTTFEMVMLYAVIMMICWYAADRRAKVLLAAMCAVLIVCTAFSIDDVRKDSRQELAVYNIPGKKAIAFIIHKKAWYDFDSALINNESLMRYNIRDHWWQCGVEHTAQLGSTGMGYELPFGKLYIVNGKKTVVIDGEISPHHFISTSKLKAEVVVLSGNTKNTIEDILRIADFKELVFDSSNKPGHLKKWIEDCEKRHIRYHDCREKAYELAL